MGFLFSPTTNFFFFIDTGMNPSDSHETKIKTAVKGTPGAYISVQNPAPPPPSTKNIFSPFPTICQNLLLMHPFWLCFCPFCIYFTLSPSISPLSFFSSSFHFYSPKLHGPIFFSPPPEERGNFPIYTPLRDSITKIGPSQNFGSFFL